MGLSLVLFPLWATPRLVLSRRVASAVVYINRLWGDLFHAAVCSGRTATAAE